MPVISETMSSSLSYDSSELSSAGYPGMEGVASMYPDPHRSAMTGSHPLSHSGLNHSSSGVHQPYPTPYSTASTTMPGVMGGGNDSQMKMDKDSIYS